MNSDMLMQHLCAYRPSGMDDLPAPFVWPRYEGLSVGNIMPTVAQALGAVLPDVLPPLRGDLLDGMLDGVERVVVLVVDALGWAQLQRMMARHPDSAFHHFAEQGRLQPITTTFLSTTNSVLSTIWTGHPPIEHGLLAYSLLLREWLMAVEAIGFSALQEPFTGTLLSWGFEPESFLPVPSISQLLSVQGILSYAVILKQYTTTPLSRMHFRGVREVIGHTSASELWLMLRRTLAAHRGERFVLSGYWSAIDTLGHTYGPLDETGDVEAWSVGTLMEKIFLQGLEPADRDGTLLLLTADHGQMTSPISSAVLIEDHPRLLDMLIMTPLGESRVPFFYVRQGRYDDAWSYLNDQLGDKFLFMSKDDVLSSGLLGPGKLYAEVPHRLGDIVGIAKGDALLTYAEKTKRKMSGHHGALSAKEMIVPLLAMRLDA